MQKPRAAAALTRWLVVLNTITLLLCVVHVWSGLSGVSLLQVSFGSLKPQQIWTYKKNPTCKLWDFLSNCLLLYCTTDAYVLTHAFLELRETLHVLSCLTRTGQPSPELLPHQNHELYDQILNSHKIHIVSTAWIDLQQFTLAEKSTSKATVVCKSYSWGQELSAWEKKSSWCCSAPHCLLSESTKK